MIVKFFLVVNHKGAVRTVKSRPTVDWNEVSISLEFHLPNALFEKPQLQGMLIIPQNVAIAQPINIEITNNIKEAIEKASGLECRLNLISLDNTDQQPE